MNQPEAEAGKTPRLDPPRGADAEDFVAAVPGQELLGNGNAGEQVTSGAAAGNEEPHGSHRMRADTFNRTPTANRETIRELPP
jgi:hypothetical protein